MKPDEFGETLSWLLLMSDKWVERRVEAIKFDQAETHRHETVDFALPKGLVKRLAELKRTAIPVPLAVLAKEPLAHLDASDATGKRLSVYTRSDNEDFMKRFLSHAAQKCLNLSAPGDADVDSTIINKIRLIVEGERGEAARVVKEFRAEGLAHPESQVGILWGTKLFRSLLLMAALGRTFFVDVPVTPERQLVKYSYASGTSLRGGEDSREWVKWIHDGALTDQVQEPARRLRRKARLDKLHWWSRTRRYPVTRASSCGSYHFEISAPSGFELSDIYPLIPEQGTGRSSILPAITILSAARANVYLSGRVQTLPPNMEMEVHIRLPRRGFLTYAWLSTFLTFLTVTGVGLLAKHLLARTTPGGLSTGVTVLLASASALNLYFARPSEHPAFSSMLFGLRVLLFTSIAAGLIGIGLLLDGNYDPSLWFDDALLSLAALVGVSAGWRGTGPDLDPEGALMEKLARDEA
jgi:hypothetical protein